MLFPRAGIEGITSAKWLSHCPPMVTLQDAIDDLYRLAWATKKKTSPKRLHVLAELVAQELESRGLKPVRREVGLHAWSRIKDWDAVYVEGDRVRVAVSCKSILRNLPGAVPNRGDDMMGEAADLQLRYPEVIIGYVTILNESDPKTTRENAAKWIRTYEQRIETLAKRTPPIWQGGMIEAGAAVRVDFQNGPLLTSPPGVLAPFFDHLVAEHRRRSLVSFVEKGKGKARRPKGVAKGAVLSSNPTLNPSGMPPEDQGDLDEDEL